MSDPLAKKRPGDPLRIPAAAFNALLDAAGAARRAAGGPPGGPGVAADPLTPAAVVWARNDTGGDLSAHAVLTPVGVVIDPAADAAAALAVAHGPVFSADTPAATTDPVLVLLEPVPDGGFGRAAAGGVALCRVNVTDAGHGYATATAADDTRLTSAARGPVRLLWTEGGTGEVWALVLIGVDSPDATGRSPSAAVLTEITGAGSGKVRQLNGSYAWADGSTLTDVIYPVEIGGSAFTPAATSNGILWEDPAQAGKYDFLPVQWATASVGGYVSTTTQTFTGDKTFNKTVYANDDPDTGALTGFRVKGWWGSSYGAGGGSATGVAFQITQAATAPYAQFGDSLEDQSIGVYVHGGVVIGHASAGGGDNEIPGTIYVGYTTPEYDDPGYDVYYRLEYPYSGPAGDSMTCWPGYDTGASPPVNPDVRLDCALLLKSNHESDGVTTQPVLLIPDKSFLGGVGDAGLIITGDQLIGSYTRADLGVNGSVACGDDYWARGVQGVTTTTSGITFVGGIATGGSGVTGLPSQTSNSGKYLTTDGSSASWATVTQLPSQGGNSGKYLTTDGSSASWATLPTELPGSPQLGDLIYYNGSAWAVIARPLDGTYNLQITVSGVGTSVSFAWV